MANVPDAGLGTHTLLCELIVWLSPLQCWLCFHGETYSIGLETLQQQAEIWQGAGGRGAFQPGSKFSICFNLEEELLWPSGDAEGAVRKGGDYTLPVKHLRYYPKLFSVSDRWCKLPVNKNLFFYTQGISWTSLCQFIPRSSGLKRRHSAMLFLSTLYLMNQ